MARTPTRYQGMDALRGLAILGIFLINIIGMGGSLHGEEYPPLLGWTAADQIAWWFQTLLIEGTMRGLLSLLFGASFVLYLHRLEADEDLAEEDAMALYYRRAFWLIVFGLFHAYVLMWPGDILFIYGLAALALYPMRDWPSRRLIGSGLVFIFMLAFLMWAPVHLAGNTPPGMPDAAEHISRFESAWVQERYERLGGYVENARKLARTAVEWNLTPFVVWWVADAFAMMLIGAGLAGRGILQGLASGRTYLLLALAGYGIGLPIRIWLAYQAQSAGFLTGPVGVTPGYQISRCAITLGHVGLFYLIWRWARFRASGLRALQPLEAVGRLALTNYIGQTILGQFILFPGFGLGLFGTLGWAGLLLLAVAVWPVQLALSTLYLRRYRTGPLEWLWRWLTRLPAGRT